LFVPAPQVACTESEGYNKEEAEGYPDPALWGKPCGWEYFIPVFYHSCGFWFFSMWSWRVSVLVVSLQQGC